MTKYAARFVFALLNLRLGVWLPNPARVVAWAQDQPDPPAPPEPDPAAVAAAQAALDAAREGRGGRHAGGPDPVRGGCGASRAGSPVRRGT